MEQDNDRLAGPDFITSLVFVIVGGVIMIAGLSMPIFRRAFTVSPGFFPTIIGGVFVFFGGIILVISARRGGAAKAKEMLSGNNLRAILHSPRFHRGMVVLAAIFAYVVLFGNEWLAALNFKLDFGDAIIPVNVGFFITTGGYLLFNFLYLKALRLPGAIAVSATATLIVFYSFSLGFGIPIP